MKASLNRFVLPIGIASTILGILLLTRFIQSSTCYNQQLLSCPSNDFLLLSGLPLLLVGAVLVAYSLGPWGRPSKVNREN